MCLNSWYLISDIVFLVELQLVDGGFAQQAGFEVGDVVLAVSGIFGDYTDALGMGIEQV